MKVQPKLRLDFEVTFTVNEQELRALDALVGYGFKSFIETFYQHLGKSYMEPHEKGLQSLFARIEELRPALSQIDDVRKSAATVAKQYSSPPA
jgi:hypothetical protein